MTKETEMLVLINPSATFVLVPKKRGNGFQKVPLGHHSCPLSDLAYKIGYDIFGLDGNLDLEVGDCTLTSGQIEVRILKPIAEMLGFPYRIVGSDEFWGKHPIESKRRVEEK